MSAVRQPLKVVQLKKHANYLPKKFKKRKKNEVITYHLYIFIINPIDNRNIQVSVSVDVIYF